MGINGLSSILPYLSSNYLSSLVGTSSGSSSQLSDPLLNNSSSSVNTSDPFASVLNDPMANDPLLQEIDGNSNNNNSNDPLMSLWAQSPALMPYNALGGIAPLLNGGNTLSFSG